MQRRCKQECPEKVAREIGMRGTLMEFLEGLEYCRDQCNNNTIYIPDPIITQNAETFATNQGRLWQSLYRSTPVVTRTPSEYTRNREELDRRLYPEPLNQISIEHFSPRNVDPPSYWTIRNAERSPFQDVTSTRRETTDIRNLLITRFSSPEPTDIRNVISLYGGQFGRGFARTSLLNPGAIVGYFVDDEESALTLQNRLRSLGVQTSLQTDVFRRRRIYTVTLRQEDEHSYRGQFDHFDLTSNK